VDAAALTVLLAEVGLVEVSEVIRLVQVLGLGGALTAFVYGCGRWALEWQRGKNRTAEINALCETQLILDREREKRSRRQLGRPRPPPPDDQR
jgi:hypothetical protein